MQLNTQPVEKRVLTYDGTYDVHSIFPTIQGEGPYTGYRATFIRLAGCVLDCSRCDTDYTSGRKRQTIKEIVEQTAGIGYDLVVITGGEPFRQPIKDLVEQLYQNNHLVQIETNGTINPEQGFPFSKCTIVVSPKTGSVAKNIQLYAAAYKYVLNGNDIGVDGLPLHALGHPAKPKLARPPLSMDKTNVYLQPEDSYDAEQNKLNLNRTVQSVLEHGYTLCLQTHKIIGVD